MGAKHEDLSASARIAISKNKLGRLFKNDNGEIQGKYRYQVYGLGEGTADNVGFAANGKFLAVEIKIPPDDLKPEQIIFKEQVLRFNGYHFTVYCEADIERMIDELKRLCA